jgi:hypothetical protein
LRAADGFRRCDFARRAAAIDDVRVRATGAAADRAAAAATARAASPFGNPSISRIDRNPRFTAVSRSRAF